MAKVAYAKHREEKAKQIIANVQNRLAGRPEIDYGKEARRRDCMWYGRWKSMAEFLKTNPSQAEMLRYGYALVEMCSGHGYMRIARISAEMLEQVIRDENLTK
jgi:hypothetical protein